MQKPAFTETMQIGIVVRDLDAAIRKYVDDYGIGPWEIYQFKPGDIKEWRENDQPVKPAQRIAVAEQVQQEDVAVCEDVQRGLASGMFDSGRFSVRREAAGYHFHVLLAEYLSRSTADEVATQVR